MININSNSLQATGQVVGHSGAVVPVVRRTFQAILGELATRPLRPLGVQQFAGAAKRNLAQQVRSDTAA